MSRHLSNATAAALAAETLAPILLVELLFESGPFRVWSGIGEIRWSGVSWSGVGDLGNVSAIEETTEIRAVGVSLALTAIPAEVLEIAVEESWQGRQATIYFAVLDGREFVGEPIRVFSGVMDQMVLKEGQQCSIAMSVESNQIDLERTRVRRWTAEDQRSQWPNDKGCDAVAALQEADILWGRA